MEVDNIYLPPQADMEAVPPPPVAAQARAPFFQTSLLKIVLLSIATWGLYILYWFHKQWYRRKAHGENVIPIARTIFAVLFAYPLFKSVNREIQRRQTPDLSTRGALPRPLNAGLLALFFLLINLLSLAGPVGILAFIPLLFVQKKMNELHAEMGFDPNEGSAFTGGDILTLAIGGFFWLLVLVGLAQG